jgi:hypothetical protein
VTDADGADWPPLPPYPTHRVRFQRVPTMTREEARRMAYEIDRAIGRYEPRNTARRTREHYERLLAYAGEKLRALERLPAEDPYENGQVLRVRRRYGNGKTTYLFAVIRAADLWYITGPGPVMNRSDLEGRRWGTLVEWLVDDYVESVEAMETKDVIYERTG